MLARVLLIGCLALQWFPVADGQSLSPTDARGPRRRQPPGLNSLLVHVPGDFPTLQTAIDGVVAGTRIVIHGGTHESIAVDKPLTLIGDPAPLFVIDPTGVAPPTPIRLVGPGSGRVILCNIAVGGYIGGPIFGASGPGVGGSGFDELHVYDSVISAPDWIPYGGVGFGQPGIDVTVPTLLVSSSYVQASDTEGADYPNFGLPPGAPGLRTSGVAVLLDSTVHGGETDTICMSATCPTPTGGAGGAGVEAETLFHANSTIQGGTGALNYPGMCFTGPSCGRAPDGPSSVVSTEVVLPGLLGSSGSPRRGSTWTLSWDPGASAALFMARERALPPFSIPQLGWYFVDASATTPWLQALPAPGSQSVFFPDDDSIVGLTLTAQLLDLQTGLLRPVITCVRP